MRPQEAEIRILPGQRWKSGIQKSMYITGSKLQCLSISPLGDAAAAGDAARVRALLAVGVDVDEADERGWTALTAASFDGPAPVVRQLIEAGADLEKADEEEETALELACGEQSYECIRLLLKAGAAVDKDNKAVQGTLSRFVGLTR